MFSANSAAADISILKSSSSRTNLSKWLITSIGLSRLKLGIINSINFAKYNKAARSLRKTFSTLGLNIFTATTSFVSLIVAL